MPRAVRIKVCHSQGIKRLFNVISSDYLVSLVISLLTNIPVDLEIKNLKER